MNDPHPQPSTLTLALALAGAQRLTDLAELAFTHEAVHREVLETDLDLALLPAVLLLLVRHGAGRTHLALHRVPRTPSRSGDDSVRAPTNWSPQ